MITSHPSTIIMIDTDAAGEDLVIEIPVCVDYLQTVDGSYGEDADGNQGGLRVEYDILDAYIEADVLKCISAELADWAIANAKVIFTTSKKHF